MRNLDEMIGVKIRLRSVAGKETKDDPEVTFVISTDSLAAGKALFDHIGRDMDAYFDPWSQARLWGKNTTGNGQDEQLTPLEAAIAQAGAETTEPAASPACPTCQDTHEIEIDAGVTECCQACTIVCPACNGAGEIAGHLPSCYSTYTVVPEGGEAAPCDCSGVVSGCAECNGQGWLPKSAEPAEVGTEEPAESGEGVPQPQCGLCSQLLERTAEADEAGCDLACRNPDCLAYCLAYVASRPEPVQPLSDPDLRTDHEQTVEQGQAEPCDHCPEPNGAETTINATMERVFVQGKDIVLFIDRCLEYGSGKGFVVDALIKRFGQTKVAAEQEVESGVWRWKKAHPEYRIYHPTASHLPPDLDGRTSGNLADPAVVDRAIRESAAALKQRKADVLAGLPPEAAG